MAGIGSRRPVRNLYLPGIHFPVGAVVSILHRVSGMVLALLLPVSLWALQQSLAGAESYAQLRQLLQGQPARVLVVLFLVIMAHHLLAGVRHLLQDVDLGISRAGGRVGAWLVLAGVLTVAAFAGYFIIIAP